MILKAFIPLALATGLAATGAIKHFQNAGPCGQLAMVESKLKLTTEQKKAIHQVFEQHRPALAARTEALVQARNAVLDAGLDPSLSAETWRPYQEKAAESVRDLAQEIRGTYLEVLPLLSETQKADGKALLNEFHAQIGKKHGPHHEMAQHLVKSRLELSDAQESAIQAIVEGHRPALKAKVDSMHQLHSGALDASLDPTSSQAVLDQNFAAIRDAGFALSSEVRATYLEAQMQLTPEQRLKVKLLVQDFRNAADGIRKLIVGF